MLWLILGGVLVATVFYFYCVRPMSYWKKLGVKQTNPVWLFGDQLDLTLRGEGITDFLVRLSDKFSKERYFGFYQMTLPTLMIQNPELIKQITIKDFDHFVDHMPFVPPEGDLLWNKNLLSLTGQEWKEMRPILSPSFTGSKMKIMFQLINELALNFVKYFKEKETETDGNVEVEIQDAFARFGNDVIASVAFGMQIDSLKDRDNKFFTLGKDVTNLNALNKRLKFFAFLLFPRLLNFFRVSLFGKEATEFFTGIIEQTIKMREEKGIVRPDMIHILLEARKEDKKDTDNGSSSHKKNITNFDIAAQAFAFFFAGFDSITNTMAFMASELAINPDIQERLRDEIEETDRECNGQITYDALMKMKYMDMVVSETLRKWPNFPNTDRVCTKPYTIEPVGAHEKPVPLKKGDTLMIPIWSIQRDPKNFPEPEKFDPERFSEDNKHNIIPSTFLTFGFGPRICIGSRLALMECKTMFYHLLLNFEIVPIAKTTIPKKLVKSPVSVLAEGGHWVGLKAK